MFSYEQLVDGITRLAEEKNPLKLATFVYHVVKQIPDNPFAENCRKGVRDTVRLVKECFGWSPKEIRELHRYLYRYVKYYKK